MSNQDGTSISRAIEQGIAHLRKAQDDEGFWQGRWRLLTLQCNYACVLVYCGHDPRSDTLQDICDQIESCARADGGIAFVPEAPSSTRITTSAIEILRRCRPQSPAIAGCERFLEREGPLPLYPYLFLERWVLNESVRTEMTSYAPPSRAMRRLVWRIAPRLLSISPTKQPAPHPRPVRRFVEKLFHWLSWPLPEDLVAQVGGLPPPFTSPMYLSLLAAQLLSKNRPLADQHEVTKKIVPELLDRYLFDDGSHYYMNTVLPTLFCLRELGRIEDEARVRAAVEKIDYQKGGWLSSPMVGMNVFDTVLAIQALRACDVADHDPMLARSIEFLGSAQQDAGGLWCWSWVARQGRVQRFADTDDSGNVICALLAGGHPVPRQPEILSTFRRLQHASGGFRSFDYPTDAFNPVTPSNTARTVMAMLAMGVSARDPDVQRALAFLEGTHDHRDTWFDFWVRGPIYGTILANEALIAGGARAIGNPSVERFLEFLLSEQNSDGGWGFDYYAKRVSSSVVEHTGLAMYALCAFSRPDALPLAALSRAAQLLVERQQPDGSWLPSTICGWDDQEGYANTVFPVVFALKGLGLFRKAMAARADGAGAVPTRGGMSMHGEPLASGATQR